MNRGRWKVVGGAAALMAVGAVLWTQIREDPCVSGGKQPMRMYERNPYIFSCEGAVYLPTSSAVRRYRRVASVQAGDIEVLPFKYVKMAGRLYYVSASNVGFDEDEYSLRVIEGVDLESLKIVDERHIQDRTNKYTVLRDGIIVEPRKGMTTRVRARVTRISLLPVWKQVRFFFMPLAHLQLDIHELLQGGSLPRRQIRLLILPGPPFLRRSSSGGGRVIPPAAAARDVPDGRSAQG